MTSSPLFGQPGHAFPNRVRLFVLALSAAVLLGLSLAQGPSSAAASVPDAPERTLAAGGASLARDTQLPAVQRSIVDPNF